MDTVTEDVLTVGHHALPHSPARVATEWQCTPRVLGRWHCMLVRNPVTVVLNGELRLTATSSMRTLPLQRVHLLRIIIRVSFDVSNNSSLPDAAAIVMKRDTVFEEVGSPWRVVMYWRRFRI